MRLTGRVAGPAARGRSMFGDPVGPEVDAWKVSAAMAQWPLLIHSLSPRSCEQGCPARCRAARSSWRPPEEQDQI